jgi:hypothetical protein
VRGAGESYLPSHDPFNKLVPTTDAALRTIKTKGEVEPRIIGNILYDNAKALYGL